MKQALNSVLSCAALALALVACDNTSSSKTFSTSEVLSSDFALVPLANVNFELSYLSGAPDTINAAPTELMVDASNYSKGRIDYNNATQVVTFTILDAMDAVNTVMTFPNSLLTATLKNGSEVPFTDLLTDVVAVHGTIDISPYQIDTLGDCEARTRTLMTIDITSDSISFDLRATKEWVDVARLGGGMVTTCRTALNQERLLVESSDPTADYVLTLLDTNGFINTNRIPQLVSYNYGYVLESATAPSASESASQELGTPAYDLETVYSKDGIVIQSRGSSLL